MTDQNFNTQLLQMQSKMLNLALILTGDRDRAYHLLQDSTLSALDHAEEYNESTAGFDTWVRGIMRSVYAEHYTVAVPKHKERVKLSSTAESEIPEGAVTPEAINHSLEALAEPQRSIVTLWITGYTGEEISTRLNVDIKIVTRSVRMFRV